MPFGEREVIKSPSNPQSKQKYQSRNQAKKKICIVSDDFLGPTRNGGIGTACSTLGETLALAGHNVTLLYSMGDYTETQPIDYWINWYKAKNITFIPLTKNSIGLTIESSSHIARSFEIYQWLKNKQYDLIYFPEWRGRGYYTALAKHQGLAFSNTIICVGVHSPTLWDCQGSYEYLNQLDQVEIDFMERQSVALADVVISPSMYMLDWLTQEEWSLPSQRIIRQNILPKNARKSTLYSKGQFTKPNEFVFFGRLYTRKGLIVFCDALDYLAQNPTLAGLTVSFLGKSVVVDGKTSIDYIRQRAQRWPWRIHLLTDYDQKSAIEYLSDDGRLAVIASLVENSPYTVLECLGAGIPFLASDIGGIPELIHPDDRDYICFMPKPKELAYKLRRAVLNGVPIARPAIPFEETEKAWLEWVEELDVTLKDRQQENKHTEKAKPLVSVCLTHFNRPYYLKQALKSLKELTYPNYEVILVDDGSNKLEALQYLKILQPYFEKRGWKIIRQSNRYLGAARNTAARHAKGEYLLFMDDDNYAKPHELDVFVMVAQKTQADILTCVMDLFTGTESPDSYRHQRILWIPLGASANVGAFKNCFGDANALIRKDVFWKLGGFSEDYGVGHEDWELFAKAVLHGYHLEVIPEALYYYRQDHGGMLRSGNVYLNHQRNIRPYLESIPPSLHLLIKLTQGQKYLNDSLIAKVESYQKQPSLPIGYNLFSDAYSIVRCIYEGESPSKDSLKFVQKVLSLLPSLTDWRVKQVLLLVCSVSLEQIEEYDLALEALNQAYQISTLLNDKETLKQIDARKQRIYDNKVREKKSQDFLQKILAADDLISALETYQKDLTPEIIEAIHVKALQVRDNGDTELAQILEELAGYIDEIIRERDALENR
jgi:glycosyltransferase involved in cell wall biosynthesis